MRIATLVLDGVQKAAVTLADGSFMEIAKAAADIQGELGDALRRGSVQALIEAGPAALAALRKLVVKAEAGSMPDAVHKADAGRLVSPIPVPRKNVFCVGRNYIDHIAEGARAQKMVINVTEVPVYFTKPSTAVIGTGADIPPRFRRDRL